MAKTRLTVKQQKFIEAYTGNATEAAKIAGYKVPRQQGQRLLSNAVISSAIQKRQEKELKPVIANRQDRQSFWTEVMSDINNQLKDRLRASELLAKSEGDFLERRDITSSDGSMKPVKEITFVPYEPRNKDHS